MALPPLQEEGDTTMPFTLGERVEVTSNGSAYHGQLGVVTDFCKNGSVKFVYVALDGVSSTKRLSTKSLRSFTVGVDLVGRSPYVDSHNSKLLECLNLVDNVRDGLNTVRGTLNEGAEHLENAQRQLQLVSILMQGLVLNDPAPQTYEEHHEQ